MKTGKDLLEALQELTPEKLAFPVIMEGCDCDGDFGYIAVEGKTIILMRS